MAAGAASPPAPASDGAASPSARLTRWGAALDPDHPLPEYPRPQLVRGAWANLNGRWRYGVTTRERRLAALEGEIVVPFAPESALSGVGRRLEPGEIAHYRRSFTPPEADAGPGARVLVHFGAVDQVCRVRVNGREVARHEGGYLPFTCDVTDALVDGENDLHVAVADPTDTAAGARGKQTLHPGGIWYTPVSGIWQTVWVETVPARWIAAVEAVADIEGGTLAVTVRAAGDRGDGEPVQIEVRDSGREVARGRGRPGRPVVLPIPDAHLWTPEDPHLYDLRVRLGRDEVTSYAAMRTVGVGPDANGVPRLLLNGRPYFHAGVLDQGYWPDGLYTAPSDEALAHDIRAMKDLGFTMLRKHIKVEPLRWYHHCDRLGMLVWQDFVNGGRPYRPWVVTVPVVVPLRLRDAWHWAFGRSDAAARARWLTEAEATVDLLRGCPCVAAWVPFNEGWGQFDALAVTEALRAWDPTRPIDHASGWHDQGGGDMHSRHVYFRTVRPARRRATDTRVEVLSEYGGYTWAVPGHAAPARRFGYGNRAGSAELTRSFVDLHTTQVAPLVPGGLSATVYTQVSDVEGEVNGLLTDDRDVLKVDADAVRAVNAALRAAVG